MGFKTDYKEITLKDFCNLNCISKNYDVVLIDYKCKPGHLSGATLSDVGITVDEIPEIFSDWYVEYFHIATYKDASELLNFVYEITIREP